MDKFNYRNALLGIREQYGDIVSVPSKKKHLAKFGENNNVLMTGTTIMNLPSDVSSETMMQTNGIVSIVSSDPSDTMTVEVLEGHTIDGNGLNFYSKPSGTTITLNGRTSVTLPTALARCTRVRLSSPANGNIYVYEGGSITNGVPDDDDQVHLVVTNGRIQSQKASTSISYQDYWLIDRITGGLKRTGNAYASIRIETKPYNAADNAWYPVTEFYQVSDKTPIDIQLTHPVIIPKNHDTRIKAEADTDGRSVIAGMSGYLASVIGTV